MNAIEIYEKDGYKITLEPRAHTFRIDSPEGQYIKSYDAYKQAEDWITTELRETAKKDRRSLSIAVITGVGEESTLLGVNLNTGNLKLSTDANYEGALYPNTPRLKKLVTELRETRERARRIANLVDGCTIKRYSHGRLESANHENYLKAVEATVEKANKAAQELETADRDGQAA